MRTLSNVPEHAQINTEVSMRVAAHWRSLPAHAYMYVGHLFIQYSGSTLTSWLVGTRFLAHTIRPYVSNERLLRSLSTPLICLFA